MKVTVHLKEASQPIIYEKARNTYTKGLMLCVEYEPNGERMVDKYPINSVFRVTEDYANWINQSKVIGRLMQNER